MVEITHKGVWFKWSSLNGRDRFWFVLSTVTAIPVGVVVGILLTAWVDGLAYQYGAGEHGPDRIVRLMQTAEFRFFVLAAFAALLVSCFAWWRFSLRQDELFNRIQNEALGRAGAWSLVAAIGWWLLSLGGWVGPLPVDLFIALGVGLIFVFWFNAVHKWA